MQPATVTILDGYARSQGYGLDFSDARRHHEIYLSDPRRAKPGKSQNHHPSSGSEVGLTFGELLEALTAQ